MRAKQSVRRGDVTTKASLPNVGRQLTLRTKSFRQDAVVHRNMFATQGQGVRFDVRVNEGHRLRGVNIHLVLRLRASHPPSHQGHYLHPFRQDGLQFSANDTRAKHGELRSRRTAQSSVNEDHSPNVIPILI